MHQTDKYKALAGHYLISFCVNYEIGGIELRPAGVVILEKPTDNLNDLLDLMLEVTYPFDKSSAEIIDCGDGYYMVFDRKTDLPLAEIALH